jgi:hypothetical protein
MFSSSSLIPKHCCGHATHFLEILLENNTNFKVKICGKLSSFVTSIAIYKVESERKKVIPTMMDDFHDKFLGTIKPSCCRDMMLLTLLMMVVCKRTEQDWHLRLYKV